MPSTKEDLLNLRDAALTKISNIETLTRARQADMKTPVSVSLLREIQTLLARQGAAIVELNVELELLKSKQDPQK